MRNVLPGTLLLLSLLGLSAGAAGQEEPSFYNGFDVEGGLIAPNEIDHGGPGRDGIPSLDKPQFLSGAQRDSQIRPGDRVVTSGDGGVFPAGVLVGQVALGRDGRLRVLLAADLQRLDYLKVLRSPPAPEVQDEGGLVVPPAIADQSGTPPPPPPAEPGNG